MTSEVSIQLIEGTSEKVTESTAKTKVAVAGATGYVGQELLKILMQHPQVQISAIGSNSKDGSELSEFSPQMRSQIQIKCQANDLESLSDDCDVLFLALPHGVAAKKLSLSVLDKAKVVDLSGDFRLSTTEDNLQWYGQLPADMALMSQAVYGLPELYRKHIASSSFIANPGCYATAALLAVAPLAKAGLIVENSVILDGKSGVSGAGRSPSLGVHFSECNESVKAYKFPHHRHCPEIEQALDTISGASFATTFSAHLVPMNRGILMTAYAQLKDPGTSYEEIAAVYESSYSDEPFLRLYDSNSGGEYAVPETRWVKGTNFCDIGFAVDKRTGKVVVVSAIDNLVKGAAGQAVQNMNLMMGYDETEGLSQISSIAC